MLRLRASLSLSGTRSAGPAQAASCLGLAGLFRARGGGLSGAAGAPGREQLRAAGWEHSTMVAVRIFQGVIPRIPAEEGGPALRCFPPPPTPTSARSPCVSLRDPLRLGVLLPGPHLTPPPAEAGGRRGPALPRPFPAWQRREGSCLCSARRKCQAQCPLPGEALHANDWALSGFNCHCLAGHPPPCRGGRGRAHRGACVWGGVGAGWQWDRRGSWHFLFVGRAARAQLGAKSWIHVLTQPRGSRAAAINPLTRLAAQPLRLSCAWEMFPLSQLARGEGEGTGRGRGRGGRGEGEGEGLQGARSHRPLSRPSLLLHQPAQPALALGSTSFLPHIPGISTLPQNQLTHSLPHLCDSGCICISHHFCS